MVGFQRGGPVQDTIARKKQNKKSRKMMPEEGEVKPQRGLQDCLERRRTGPQQYTIRIHRVEGKGAKGKKTDQTDEIMIVLLSRDGHR